MLTYRLTYHDLCVVGRYVDNACVGGVSRLGARKGDPKEHQVTGLIGNYALALWRDGHNQAFIDAREAQDQTPTTGDGGQDLLGLDFDVKASCMRGSDNPLNYNLWVRPDEYHDGHTYALCLIKAKNIDEIRHSLSVDVFLVGWCESQDLVLGKDSGGRDRYERRAKVLYSMPPMRYRVAV